MGRHVEWAATTDDAAVGRWARTCGTKWVRQRGVSDPLGGTAKRSIIGKEGVAHAPISRQRGGSALR